MKGDCLVSLLLALTVIVAVVVGNTVECYCDEQGCLAAAHSNHSTCNGSMCYFRVTLYFQTCKRVTEYGCFKPSSIFDDSLLCTADPPSIRNDSINPLENRLVGYNCCTATPHCNANLTYDTSKYCNDNNNDDHHVDDETGHSNYDVTPVVIPIAIIGTIVLLSCVALVAVIVAVRRRKSRSSTIEGGVAVYEANNEDNTITGASNIVRKVAHSVAISGSIGWGTYGEVHLGYYNGCKCAVKKSTSVVEESWKQESLIYKTYHVNHPNILSCLAIDIFYDDKEGESRMWLILEYHERGSLFDLLNQQTLSLPQVITAIMSISNGLAYLHKEMKGTGNGAYKPSIAHRDIKSKNILMKDDGGTCCIADFGIALANEPTLTESMLSEINIFKGTNRYMAPEILNDTIFANKAFRCSFSFFLYTDMYSFGLVMYEICKRCSDCGPTEYSKPYEDLVPQLDPSIEDMKRVVVDEKKRPTIPDAWAHTKIMRNLTWLITYCWDSHPFTRPSALLVYKTLDDYLNNNPFDYNPFD